MKTKIISITLFCIFLCGISLLFFSKKPKEETTQITGTILKAENGSITVQSTNQSIYTFPTQEDDFTIGDKIVLVYSGLLNEEQEQQQGEILEYNTSSIQEELLPVEWQEEGIFKDELEKAYQKLKTLSLDEKIGQLLLVRYDEDKALEDLKTYHFGGFVFFEKDFKNKTKADVVNMMSTLQEQSKIPLLTAVDEEGGKVVRISFNPNLVPSPFLSSKELYQQNGFDAIKEDTINKSQILSMLGINLNLAPVVDISTNESDYMYERSFGKDKDLTAQYAKTVIEASKNTSVSYTLKHFPGYGNNKDTHNESVVDTRDYETIIQNDLIPFDAGIKSGAEAVLMSHNIIKNIDEKNPASLSVSLHNLLRNRLEFSGIILTDDLDMGATKNIKNRAVQAILSGNDMIITTDYASSFSEIKAAVNNKEIADDLINRVALRVLAWKYHKGLITDNEK